MSRRALILTVSLVSILAVISVYFGFYGRSDKKINTKTEAASSSKTLTSQAEWTAGTNTNTDLASAPGSVKISSKAINQINTGSWTSNSPTGALLSWAHDGDTATLFSMIAENSYVQIDFGVDTTISEAIIYTHEIPPGPYAYSYSFQSWNGTTWDTQYTNVQGVGNSWPDTHIFSPAVTSTKVRFVQVGGLNFELAEWANYNGGNAVHTSSTTQLDTGNHITTNWTTFVPSGTIPANTSINFRFRTSPDAGTWGSWTASTAYAGSIDIGTLLGATDAAKRYLQVETTLANTDGASTPTLDAYTANYNYDDTPIPTCSDGIQNGTETGVDCGGSCTACPVVPPVNPPVTPPVRPPLICPIINVDQYCIGWAGDASDACAALDQCLLACEPGFTGADQSEKIGVVAPNGGESYRLKEQMNLKWVYATDNGDKTVYPDLSKGEKTKVLDVPVGVVLSTDGGVTYNKLLAVLFPNNKFATVPSLNNDYTQWMVNNFGGIKPYTWEHRYDASLATSLGYYSYNLTLPDASSLITSAARIKLVPIEFGCTSVAADTSDNNFTILAGLPTPPVGPIVPPIPPVCVGTDCQCNIDSSVCSCVGPDCACSNPDVCQICTDSDPTKCNPCVGDRCKPKPCIGDNCTPTPPCTSIWCKLFPPGGGGTAGTICIGSLCVATPSGWPINPLVLVPLLAALLLAIANPENLLVIGNAISRFYGLFGKGKDKKHALGITYDAATGLPVTKVLVLLYRARDKKLITTVKSDDDGRFALETPPGEEYYIEIEKTGYDLMKKQTFSGMALAYEQNYFAQNIFRPSDVEKLFDKALPLSANSNALTEVKKFGTLESISKILRILNLPIILFGAVMSGIAHVKSHSTINIIVLSLYGALILYYIIKWLILSGRSFGKVYDVKNNKGIELATISLISETDGKLKATAVSDARGRFVAVVPKGFYKLIISKPGYIPEANHATRIKTSLTPARVIIGINRIDVHNDNITTVTTSDIKSTAGNREIADSSEIIERFNQKRTKFGTTNLADVGVHHLINQNQKSINVESNNNEIKVPSDEEISKTKKPNWQIPGSHTPL